MLRSNNFGDAFVAVTVDVVVDNAVIVVDNAVIVVAACMLLLSVRTKQIDPDKARQINCF